MSRLRTSHRLVPTPSGFEYLSFRLRRVPVVDVAKDCRERGWSKNYAARCCAGIKAANRFDNIILSIYLSTSLVYKNYKYLFNKLAI